MDIEFIASLVRQAFALAFYSAGIGGALGVAFVMVIWCALRPGTTTVVGTGLVALAVLGAGAHGAVHGGHSFAGGVVLFWGAVFVALSLRGAKTLEPASFSALRGVRTRVPALDAVSMCRAAASGGPYRRQDALVDEARRWPRAGAARSSSAQASLAWSRSLVAVYALAVVAVFAGVGLAS